jgi:hypothetical protein
MRNPRTSRSLTAPRWQQDEDEIGTDKGGKQERNAAQGSCAEDGGDLLD